MNEKSTLQKQIIRVIYPGVEGQIALRTDSDWECNLAAQFVSREDCCWEFSIETRQPFFYFKPVLIRDGAVDWSRGENFLAVATSGASLAV